MIGGWTLAAAHQPRFDAVRETISALASAPARSPWLMTAGLAVTGVSYVLTAGGLRGARPAGRIVLAVGGVATAAVAALPVVAFPGPHGVAAAAGFAALTAWPALATPAGRADPYGRRTGVAASAVLLALLIWFVAELQHLTPDGGTTTGLAERFVAGGQSLWPLAAVLLARRRVAQ
jgi:hypothetical membrane protein